jgi:c-di-GMP-binding flagellar brake protein YcgR
MTLEGDLVVGSGPGARMLRIVTCDLGAGGASIESPEPLDEGAAVTLQLTLAGAAEGAPRMIALPATVTRVEGENPCRLALTFAGAPPTAVEALKRFIFRARDRTRR